MGQKFDLLITNGRIVDGTGNPYYKADIGLSGGKILRIGVVAVLIAMSIKEGELRTQKPAA